MTQLNSSLIYSYNFAYGGATTDASLVAPYTPTVLSLIDQVKIFSSNLASHPSYAPWTSTNTLVGIWMGINDVGNSWYTSNYNTLVNQILTRYFDQVQILHNAGVRKFLFLSVPPIQKTPSVIAAGASSQQGEAAALTTYNNLIVSKANAFKSANPGVITYYLDTATPFNTAINNPTAYGAQDATCYDASGTKCLWWNDVGSLVLYCSRSWLTTSVVSSGTGYSKARSTGCGKAGWQLVIQTNETF